MNLQVVSKDSATLNLPNEKVYQANANHRTICKFGSAESQDYKQVSRAIADMVKKIIAKAN